MVEEQKLKFLVSNLLGVDKKNSVKAKQYTGVFSTKLDVQTEGKIATNPKKRKKKKKQDNQVFYGTTTYRERTLERKNSLTKKRHIKDGGQPFNYQSNSVESKGDNTNRPRRMVEIISPEFDSLRKKSDSRSKSQSGSPNKDAAISNKLAGLRQQNFPDHYSQYSSESVTQKGLHTLEYQDQNSMAEGYRSEEDNQSLIPQPFNRPRVLSYNAETQKSPGVIKIDTGKQKNSDWNRNEVNTE